MLSDDAATVRGDEGEGFHSYEDGVGERTGKARRIYECPVDACGKVFGRSSHLSRHYKSTHTQPFAFKCPVPTCSRRFSRSDILKKHVKVHTTGTNAVRIVSSTGTLERATTSDIFTAALVQAQGDGTTTDTTLATRLELGHHHHAGEGMVSGYPTPVQTPLASPRMGGTGAMHAYSQPDAGSNASYQQPLTISNASYPYPAIVPLSLQQPSSNASYPLSSNASYQPPSTTSYQPPPSTTSYQSTSTTTPYPSLTFTPNNLPPLRHHIINDARSPLLLLQPASSTLQYHTHRLPKGFQEETRRLVPGFKDEVRGSLLTEGLREQRRWEDGAKKDG